MGFSRQDSWSGLPFSSPEDLLNPGTNLGLLHCRQTLNHLSHQNFSSVQLSRSVVLDSLWFYPMNHNTPGVPVHHQLPEFIQTHVHRVGDTVQTSYPLSSPSPPAPNPSQHQGLFQWVNSAWDGQSIGVSALASVLPMNTQDWSPLEWTGWISVVQGTLKSLLQHHTSKIPIIWHSAFFTVQLSHPDMTNGKTIALTRWTFVGKVMPAFEYAI